MKTNQYLVDFYNMMGIICQRNKEIEEPGYDSDDGWERI